jgi:sortase A
MRNGSGLRLKQLPQILDRTKKGALILRAKVRRTAWALRDPSGLFRRVRYFTPKQWLATGLSILSLILVVGSGWLAGYPFYTDWRAARQQRALADAFRAPALKDAFDNGGVGIGSPLTRLMIPKLGVDIVVVEGTSPRALAAGAGHYQSTPLPGELGNMAIAGHRNINGKPFGEIDQLEPGDKIILVTPSSRFTYVVSEPQGRSRNPWVTKANDWSVIAPTETASLTLTTCHPYGSNKQRLVVRAVLETGEVQA